MFACAIGIIITMHLMKNLQNDVNANMQTKQEVEKYIYLKDEDEVDIDFTKLKKTNSDTVGYLEVLGTNTKYVVVKGKDNDYYLTHDFKKNYNVAGWIFADYRNKGDGKDMNLVIYGHQTYNDTMFGALSKLLKKETIKDEDNLIINYTTDRERKKYKIFSIYTVEPETYYIKTSFKENEFEKFKVKLKERSIYKIDVNIKNKNIITLSTCQNHGVKRLAIHAVEL